MKRIAKFAAAGLVLTMGLGSAALAAEPTDAQKAQALEKLQTEQKATQDAQKAKLQEEQKAKIAAQQQQHQANVEAQKAKLQEEQKARAAEALQKKQGEATGDQ